ncbi:MAG: class I SAM-dependent methyltransferase [Candidatus Aminicenantes bacterium]|jgi:2-polyprenyl-3-methyl-5-hydroxy-6-metoxy-1,4-benzoquinol methylase
MNRFKKEFYESMVWSQAKSPLFTKPPYEKIKDLKEIPLEDREPKYSEFYELQIYLDVLGNIKPGKMVDLGCGSGALSSLFTKLGWEVVSCDHDDLFNNGLQKIDFVKTDLNEDFPFESEFCNLVVAKQVIEHLNNPTHFLSEIARILRPGGIVFLSTPNISSLASRYTVIRSGYHTYFEGMWKEHRSPVHYEQLKVFMEEAGFAEIDFFTNRYELYNLNKKVNGRKRRFIGPLLKILTKKNMPESCMFGMILMVYGEKKQKR